MRIWACFFCKWWWNDSLFFYENYLFCFQIFFNVNCLLMVCYVYHCSCFLKVVIEVKNCSCSLVGILVKNLCLWPAECGKHLNFWRCIQNLRLVLRGSDTNEGRCKHFCFCWLFCWVKLHHWMENHFFYLWVRFEVEVLLCSIFTEIFAIGFQNWFDHDWNEMECSCWSSLRSISSNLHGLKSVICVYFQRYDVFLIFNLRGVKVFFQMCHTF